MANDVVPNWLFPVVFGGFLAGILLLYWWLKNRKK